MTIPTGFFDKVVAEVSRMYQVTDGEGYNVETDPVVRLCVRVAYQQICAHIKTTLHKEERTVVYPAVYGPMPLMHSPIDTQLAITVESDFVQLATNEYNITDGVLYLAETPDPRLCYGEPHYVKVKCTAGITAISEESNLHSALVIQGIANFNRRDLLGFTQVTGEKGTSRSVSDKGVLLDAVKELIQDYLYYGDGRICT